MALDGSSFPEPDGLLQKILLEEGPDTGDESFQVNRFA